MYLCEKKVLVCLNLSMLADLKEEGREGEKEKKRRAASAKMECLTVW